MIIQKIQMTQIDCFISLRMEKMIQKNLETINIRSNRLRIEQMVK